MQDIDKQPGIRLADSVKPLSHKKRRASARLCCVLQRYHCFGFKPFITNMEARVEITGAYNEDKK